MQAPVTARGTPIASPLRGHLPRLSFDWVVRALLAFDVAILIASGVVIGRWGTVDWRSGFSLTETADGLVVANVEPGSRVVGLIEPGDRVVAIDGERRLDRTTVQLLSRSFAAGARLTVERRGRVSEVRLPSLSIPRRGAIASLAVTTPPAVALVVAGASVGILRPFVPAARLFSIASLLAAPTVFTKDLRLTQRGAPLMPWENWIGSVAHRTSPLHLIAALAFLLAFPVQPLPRVIRVVARLVAGAGIVAWSASALIDFSETVFRPTAIALAWNHPTWWRAAEGMAQLYAPVTFATMTAVVAAKYRGTLDREERRRLVWLTTGAIGGLLPLGTYFLASAVMSLSGGRALPAIVSDLAFLWVAILPVTVAYAVARHRLFDIHVIVRRGLQYLLARNSLRAALGASVLLLVIEIARDPSRPVGDLLRRPLVPAALAASSALLVWRSRIVDALDRRFFRVAYDFESVLASMIDDIDRQSSPAKMAQVVAERLETSIRPESLQVFLRDDDRGDLICQHGSGESADATSAPVLAADSAIIQTIEHSGKPMPLGRTENDVLAGPQPAPGTPQLAIPIGGADRPLVGVLLLGAKRSDEPYSPRDMQLLETIAAQMVMAHENAALRRRIGEERRVREEVLSYLDERGVNIVRECPVCGACFDRDASVCEHDGNTLILAHPIEREVNGRWRLERRLGAGGMGAVYEALDRQLDRRVALKVMRPEHSTAAHLANRFEREARALARLRHPNIVTLFDAGRAKSGSNFIVMELVPGATLRHELRPGGVPPARFVAWFDQILDAVGYAHRHGVIHRDLKPENILLATTEDGARVAKVLDFGLAKFGDAGSDVTALTKTGAVLGTLAYMAPEQLLGRAVDERSDVFALGTIAAEAVSGRHPFRDDNVQRTAIAILNDPIRLPGDDPQIRTLEATLARATAKRRADRYATIEAFRAEVIAAMRGCPPLPAAAGSSDGTLPGIDDLGRGVSDRRKASYEET